MRYCFDQLQSLSCADIAAKFEGQLIGTRAVNTSFDSGRIARVDWATVNGFTITPPITKDLVAAWPVSHEGYCDEWWVFELEIPTDFEVQAFCNYVGTRIADYKELDFEGGCPLDSYLARFQPRMVFGNNELGYVISQAEHAMVGNPAGSPSAQP